MRSILKSGRIWGISLLVCKSLYCFAEERSPTQWGEELGAGCWLHSDVEFGWVAGEELRPRRGFVWGLMSEVTWIWMNNFIELSYCQPLFWGVGSRVIMVMNFYYPSWRIRHPTGLLSSGVIIRFDFRIQSHVLCFCTVNRFKGALLSPHLAFSTIVRPHLHSELLFKTCISGHLCWSLVCELLQAAACWKPTSTFRDQSTQD